MTKTHSCMASPQRRGGTAIWRRARMSFHRSVDWSSRLRFGIRSGLPCSDCLSVRGSVHRVPRDSRSRAAPPLWHRSPVSDLILAITSADIALAVIWSTTPFISPGMLRRGAHVTTLGADEPGKAEVSVEVIRSALFVCDDRYLAVGMGALAWCATRYRNGRRRTRRGIGR